MKGRKSGFTETATGWSGCARLSRALSSACLAIRSRLTSSLRIAPSGPPTAITSSSTTEPPGCCSSRALKPRRKSKGRGARGRRGGSRDLDRDHLVILEHDGPGIAGIDLGAAPIVHIDDQLLVGRERELRHVGSVKTLYRGIATLLVPGAPHVEE